MDRVGACKIGNRKEEGEFWKISRRGKRNCTKLYDREEFHNLAFVVFSVGSKKDRRN